MTLKRTFITFWRMVHTGVKNFIRNAWLSVAATAVMVVALSIISLAIVLNATARGAITELSKNLKISIYIKDSVKDSDRVSLMQDLQSNQYVSSVTYISTAEAKEKFAESFKNDEQLLEGLTLVGGDTLPASLEVSVSNLEKIEEVAQIARDDKFVGVVESITLGKTDAKKTIDRAASAQRFIITSSIIAASIFGTVSVLIIFNTIRMAIFTRSEEIKIMKLIGATPGYIRGPFLVEASIYGVIAGVISISAVYGMILSLGSKVATQAEFSATYQIFTGMPLVVFAMVAGSIIVGILVGVLSSMLAMEKYLRLRHW